jgi:hypothetical protein
MSTNSESLFQYEKRTFKLLTICTLIITVMMTVVSLLGLLIPTSIYPSQALQESFATNDLVNMIIGLPILLGSLWLTQRGNFLGLFFWPGSLMFVIYNYISYMVAMPLNWLYPLYAVLVLGSLFIFYTLITGVESVPIRQLLCGKVHEKLAGGLLVGLGSAFLLRALSILAGPLFNHTTLPVTDLSVLVSDISLSIAWVISGVLLWRHKALGYKAGGAMLFQGVTLFLGLILFMLLNPLFTQASFDLVGVVIVFLMSVLCNIPFGLFVQGVLKLGKSAGSSNM